MTRAVLLSALVLISLSCSRNAPEQVKQGREPYTVEAMSVDPATNSISIRIRVRGPASQSNVKTQAESVISQYRDQYKIVTVKSYTPGLVTSGLPYATSTFENNKIEHRFDPQAATQKIPSH
jgi:hypothetical protein